MEITEDEIKKARELIRKESGYYPTEDSKMPEWCVKYHHQEVNKKQKMVWVGDPIGWVTEDHYEEASAMKGFYYNNHLALEAFRAFVRQEHLSADWEKFLSEYSNPDEDFPV